MPDVFKVNLMPRLVNEDKTPMDIHEALNFLERNNLEITKRWGQLRKNTAISSSEY
jgi:hypothetical protein